MKCFHYWPGTAAVSLTLKVMNHPCEREDLNTVMQGHTLHRSKHIQTQQRHKVKARFRFYIYSAHNFWSMLTLVSSSFVLEQILNFGSYTHKYIVWYVNREWLVFNFLVPCWPGGHVTVWKSVIVLSLQQINIINCWIMFPKRGQICWLDVSYEVSSVELLIHKTHRIRILHYRLGSQHQRTTVAHETCMTIAASLNLTVEMKRMRARCEQASCFSMAYCCHFTQTFNRYGDIVAYIWLHRKFLPELASPHTSAELCCFVEFSCLVLFVPRSLLSDTWICPEKATKNEKIQFINIRPHFFKKYSLTQSRQCLHLLPQCN